MNAFERLKEHFTHFPGIGPRQAERFAYFLLSKDQAYLEEIKALLSSLKRDVTQCTECLRYFAKRSDITICPICSNPEREEKTLMLVAKDNDLLTIEKSGAFNGKYFVLGGLIPILEKNPEKRIRLAKLLEKMTAKKELKEIILALSATHEGEHTGDIITSAVKDLLPEVKITHLGRGLSTGLEIEYSDSDTIKAALQNKY